MHFEEIHGPDVISSIEASTSIHQLYNYLIHSVMENENANRKKEHASKLDAVLEFIRDQYSENITIDEIQKAYRS